MIYDRLRVFVSSKMEELAPERRAVKAALESLSIEAWVYEADAGARPASIRETYLTQLESADLYIGIFWRRFGDYTIDEFEHAKKLGKDCLIYEKRSDIEGQRDPQLQQFLDRLGQVETGLSVHWFNTPEELGKAVHHDAARWQAEIVRKYRTSHGRRTQVSAGDTDRDELRILLDRVKKFWVDGVLQHSIHGEGLLDLGKQTRPDAIEHPWEAVLELPFEGNRIVPSHKRIADVFSDVDRSLLILGQPGSGKTTTLLELARDMIADSEETPEAAVPVVFNLSAWTDPGQSLATWLEGELSAKYQIPRRVGGVWLEQNRLLLLLDGLDEVRADCQAACVRAINEFAESYGAPGIVVCSRLQDYSALPERLKLNGAVSLQPLTEEQIFANLPDGGAGPLKNLLLRHDVLLQLAQSPLMLSIMTLAYQGSSADDLQGPQFDTLEGCRKHLFDTYIDRMFRRKGKKHRHFSRERMVADLSWLAGRMANHNKSIFLIEDLQPSWLARAAQRFSHLAGFSLILGLVSGLVGVFFWFGVSPTLDVATTTSFQNGWWLVLQYPVWFFMIGVVDRLLHRMLIGRTTSSMVGRGLIKVVIYFGLWIVWPVLAWFTGLWDSGWITADVLLGIVTSAFLGILARNHQIASDIKTVEALSFSPLKAMQGGLWGLLLGFAVYQAYLWLWACFWKPVPPEWFPYFWQDEEELFCSVAYPALGGVVGMVVGGLVPRVVGRKTTANQGMRMSIRNSLMASLLAGVVVGVTAWILFEAWRWLPHHTDTFTTAQVILYPVSVGTLTAYFAGLWFGALDMIKHYWLRFILIVTGQTPRNLVGLLDEAVSLNFLQRVGGGYIFVHRFLLQHFAAGSAVRASASQVPVV